MRSLSHYLPGQQETPRSSGPLLYPFLEKGGWLGVNRWEWTEQLRSPGTPGLPWRDLCFPGLFEK